MQAQRCIIVFPLWWRWATYVQHMEYFLFAFQAWIKMVHFPILEFAWNSRGWIVLVLFWVGPRLKILLFIYYLFIQTKLTILAYILRKSRVFLIERMCHTFMGVLVRKKDEFVALKMWTWPYFRFRRHEMCNCARNIMGNDWQKMANVLSKQAQYFFF